MRSRTVWSPVRPEEAHQFHLSTEEYLHSLVSVINELSRLAVNSVTLGENGALHRSAPAHRPAPTGDFGTPLRLSAFVKDLHAGFQLLNLKNDSLRKRFDSIKVRRTLSSTQVNLLADTCRPPICSTT